MWCIWQALAVLQWKLKILSFSSLSLQVFENLHISSVCPQTWRILWDTRSGLCSTMAFLWTKGEETLSSPTSPPLPYQGHGDHTVAMITSRTVPEHVGLMMPGTTSPLEEKAAMILPTSPVAALHNHPPLCSVGRKAGKLRDNTRSLSNHT